MSSTTFVDLQTPIVASWLNDVNTAVYNDLGGPGVLGTAAGGSKVGTPPLTNFPATTVSGQLAQIASAVNSGGGIAGVTTFNGRSGTVVLNGADVTAGLGYNVPNQMNAVLLGTPIAPTPPTATNDVTLATTQFVRNAITAYAPGGGGSGVISFQGRTGAVTLLSADVTGSLGYTPAALASPAFTGTPTVPTAAPGTNTTQAASTAFVTAAVVASTTGVSSFNTRTGAVTLTGADVTTALNATSPYLSYLATTAGNSFVIVRDSKTTAGTLGINGSALAMDVETSNSGYVGAGISTVLNASLNSYSLKGTDPSWPQNVGAYIFARQFGNAVSGTPATATNPSASVWGGCYQVEDASGLTRGDARNTANALVGIEIDVNVNGIDTRQSTVGIDLTTFVPSINGTGTTSNPWIAYRASGNPTDHVSQAWQYGFYALTGTNSSFFSEAVGVYGMNLVGSYQVALDLSNSTNATGSAIRIKAGDYLNFDGTDQYAMRLNSGRIEFWNRGTGTRHGYVDVNSGADVAFGGGGGGGSGVSSFNTRTGVVTLIAADVNAAMGFTPLSNITGVTTTTTQNITGSKTFTALLNANSGVSASFVFSNGDIALGLGSTVEMSSSGNVRAPTGGAAVGELRVLIDGTPYYIPFKS